MIAQADWESRPDVGSSRNKSSLGFEIVSAASKIWLQRMYLCCELNPDGSTLAVFNT
jgi:hypothetical protein